MNLRYAFSQAASDAAMNSASHVDSACVTCFRDRQATQPFREKNTYPVRDRRVSLQVPSAPPAAAPPENSPGDTHGSARGLRAGGGARGRAGGRNEVDRRAKLTSGGAVDKPWFVLRKAVLRTTALGVEKQRSC